MKNDRKSDRKIKVDFLDDLKRNGATYIITDETIEVKKQGSIYMNSLKAIPPNVVFENWGNVSLTSIESLPPGIVFMNAEYVDMNKLSDIPKDVVFMNEGDVYLKNVNTSEWECSIDGISDSRILTLMIKKEIVK